MSTSVFSAPTIHGATLPGDLEAPNEDARGFKFDCAWVLDGATLAEYPPKERTLVSDFVSCVNDEIGTSVGAGPDAPLRDIVAEAMTSRNSSPIPPRGGDHWRIRDSVKNTLYQSLQDTTGENCDSAYVARSVRRAGAETTFISIAGIHAEGSAIAAEHLASRRTIARLQKRTKRRLFSLALSGEFSKDPLEVVSSHELALHLRPEASPTPPRGVVSSLPDPTDGAAKPRTL